ncbi:MAG: IS630 family transposase [bacterium]
MVRPKELVDKALCQRAKEAMEQIKDHKVCVRLQAIAGCASQPVNTVASVMGVSRHTVWRWAKRFRAQGVEGLCDSPRGHNPAKLDEAKRKQVARWLKTGKDHEGERVHWTLAALADEVERVFEIRVSTTSLWTTVRGMGFRQKAPRPVHTKADPQAQERFKKNG